MKKKALALFLILLTCLSTAVAEGLTEAERGAIAAAAERLRAVGLEFSDELLEEHIGQMEEWKIQLAAYDLPADWQAYHREQRLDEAYQAYELLMFLGMGRFNEETWRYEPVSEQVYAFDDEVMWVDTMYEDFLTRIGGIIPGIQITGIREYLAGMTSTGGGKRTVMFTCDGHVYRFTLDSWTDWLNLDIVDRLNGVLDELGYDGRLHMVGTEDQIVILIYGSDDWAGKVCQAVGVAEYEGRSRSVLDFFNAFQ